jgi:hypothetical protein
MFMIQSVKSSNPGVISFDRHDHFIARGYFFQSGALSRLLEIYIRAQPIMRRGCMALAGGVFGQKDIARMKSNAGAVADADIDAAGQRNHPTAVRGSMVVNDVRREIIPKEQAMDIASGIEELGSFAQVQRFEVGLPVIVGIESVELHGIPPGVMKNVAKNNTNKDVSARKKSNGAGNYCEQSGRRRNGSGS